MDNATYSLCSEVDETHFYLFAECSWIVAVQIRLFTWVGVVLSKTIVQQTMAWIKSRHQRQFKKEVDSYVMFQHLMEYFDETETMKI